MKPDYDKSVGEVFTMAIITEIQHSEDLEVLNLVDHGNKPHQDDLPSWVADLRTIVGTWRFTKFDHNFEIYYHGSVDFSPDLRLLHVDGFAVDTAPEICVPENDSPFRPISGPNGDGWTWNIRKMATLILHEGGIYLSRKFDNACTRKDYHQAYRSVERAVYEVMIAGQLSTLSQWVQHDAQYPDECQSHTRPCPKVLYTDPSDQPRRTHGTKRPATTETENDQPSANDELERTTPNNDLYRPIS